YGANRCIIQSPCRKTYSIRSCKRLLLPCQNSIRNGLTKYPPQKAGRSIGTLSAYSAVNSSTRVSNIFLSEMTWLCGEATAPIRLPLGRDAKYSSESSEGNFSAQPSMRTCLCSSGQNNKRLTFFCFAIACPFLL